MTELAASAETARQGLLLVQSWSWSITNEAMWAESSKVMSAAPGSFFSSRSGNILAASRSAVPALHALRPVPSAWEACIFIPNTPGECWIVKEKDPCSKVVSLMLKRSGFFKSGKQQLDYLWALKERLSLVVEGSAGVPAALHNGDFPALEVVFCGHHFHLLHYGSVHAFDQPLEHCLGIQHCVLCSYFLHAL